MTNIKNTISICFFYIISSRHHFFKNSEIYTIYIANELYLKVSRIKTLKAKAHWSASF